MIYEPFSVVKVPFPFTDSAKQKKRPALVLSSMEFQQKNGHIVLAMITSAKHSSWFGDLLISDLKLAGLKAQSIVRQKIFTIDSRLVEKQLGVLSKEECKQIRRKLSLSLSSQI